MYNKEYAEQWIANHESRKDVFRTEQMEPKVKAKIQSLSETAQILDIGCGWGMVAEFIFPTQKYIGVDPTKEFFPYIFAKFPEKNIMLLEGKLPDQIPTENTFDFVICSMALHCTGELTKSLSTIFSKVKEGGTAYIIDFNDAAEKYLRETTYNPVHEEDEFHIKGVSTLPSGISMVSETYFHKEKSFEKEFDAYGTYTKEYLGPLFVVYEIKKK